MNSVDQGHNWPNHWVERDATDRAVHPKRWGSRRRHVDEVQISKVAAVLSEWNPLGSRADSVSDLDGYRIEAIDIIMALGVFRRLVAPEKTVSDILNQAFDLSLKPIDCVAPVRKIQRILGSDQ
jgi:hypothetical protein